MAERKAEKMTFRRQTAHMLRFRVIYTPECPGTKAAANFRRWGVHRRVPGCVSEEGPYFGGKLVRCSVRRDDDAVMLATDRVTQVTHTSPALLFQPINDFLAKGNYCSVKTTTVLIHLGYYMKISTLIWLFLLLQGYGRSHWYSVTQGAACNCIYLVGRLTRFLQNVSQEKH